MPGPPDAFLKFMNAFHRGVLTVSGGRVGRNLGGMEVIELTTTGRKSGTKRTVILTVPLREGDDLVVVASKGGRDDHPAWYLNLVADPAVDVLVGGATVPMTARVATADEKAEMWPRITSRYKGYQGYQDKTERDIPLVVLTPR
jgi:deazaflavin-dependent oxidoreductase (nitroreductase family)